MRVVTAAAFDRWSIGTAKVTCIQNNVGALTGTRRATRRIYPPHQIRIDGGVLGRDKVCILASASRRGCVGAAAAILDADRMIVAQIRPQQSRVVGADQSALRIDAVGGGIPSIGAASRAAACRIVTTRPRRVNNIVHRLRAVMARQARQRDRTHGQYGAVDRAGVQGSVSLIARQTAQILVPQWRRRRDIGTVWRMTENTDVFRARRDPVFARPRVTRTEVVFGVRDPGSERLAGEQRSNKQGRDGERLGPASDRTC